MAAKSTRQLSQLPGWIINLVRDLDAAGRSTTLLPHVLDNPFADNDVVILEAVQRELHTAVKVEIPIDLDHVRTIIAGSKIVIGARMHACLNALSMECLRSHGPTRESLLR